MEGWCGRGEARRRGRACSLSPPEKKRKFGGSTEVFRVSLFLFAFRFGASRKKHPTIPHTMASQGADPHGPLLLDDDFMMHECE